MLAQPRVASWRWSFQLREAFPCLPLVEALDLLCLLVWEVGPLVPQCLSAEAPVSWESHGQPWESGTPHQAQQLVIGAFLEVVEIKVLMPLDRPGLPNPGKRPDNPRGLRGGVPSWQLRTLAQLPVPASCTSGSWLQGTLQPFHGAQGPSQGGHLPTTHQGCDPRK